MRTPRCYATTATALAVLTVTLTGCGSGAPDYGKQYLAALAPYAAASAAFTQQYEQHLNWTFPQVLAAEQGQLKAGAAFDYALLHDNWPVAYRYDIGLLEQANTLYFSELTNPRASELEVGDALNLTAEDDARVREDLNLPIVQDEVSTVASPSS